MRSNKFVSDFHLKQVTSLLLMMMMVIKLIKLCDASCYFPAEYQGEYITQSTVTDNDVQYSVINITENSIPIWGLCHRRHENNVVLKIGSEETDCYRCFHLKLVSKNILRVLTADIDYISKCYTNEEKALGSCLNDDTLEDESKNTEIILFKTREWNGEEVRQEYCPIHGRYKVTYNIDDGTDERVECPTQDSDLDSCPSGSAMNLRFRKCSFENQEVTFECLGHWKGLRNQNYLAVMNVKNEAKLGPKFRCATYVENPKTNIVEVSFSKDSTCRSINKYHTTGNNYNGNGINNNFRSEILTLHPVPQDFGPLNQFCSFPNWLIGHWEHVIVSSGQMIYKDHTSFKTYTMKCVKNYTNHEQDKFMVYSQTQCGEEVYQCLKIQKRDTNVFEFQISAKTSTNFTNVICHDIYFNDDRWLTQGRLESNNIMSPCPISGEFTGIIPDDLGLCAKLSSECQSQDIMYYQISACDYDEIYEEREYRCLGQWQHKNLVYTYTKRRDVGTYECFVGTLLSDKQIFIKEAGEHCQRDVNPYRFGMELNKVAHCNPADIFKTSNRPTHKYSDVSTLRSTTNLLSSSSNEFAETSSTPQPIVTNRNNVQYSVTNLPKQQQTTTKTIQVASGSNVPTSFNYLLLISFICVILVFNKVRN